MLTRTALQAGAVAPRRVVVARFSEKPKEHPSSYCGGTSSITIDEAEYEDAELMAAIESINAVKAAKPQPIKIESSVFQYPGVPCGGTTSLSVDEEDGYNKLVIEAAEKAVEALKEKEAAAKEQLANSNIEAAHAIRFSAHEATAVPGVPTKVVVPNGQTDIQAADVLRLHGH